MIVNIHLMTVDINYIYKRTIARSFFLFTLIIHTLKEYTRILIDKVSDHLILRFYMQCYDQTLLYSTIAQRIFP